jgi:hypothetical protein
MAKRLGRPMKAPTPGERVPLGLRVTAEMKRTLEAAAIESGRSISAEAELRLEQSFEREWILKRFHALLRKELKR